MPLYAETATNTMLDNMWDNVPAFEVGLLHSDPRKTMLAVELDATGGYARVPGTAADWSPASGGSKEMAVKTFPAPSAAWSATAIRWAIFVGAELWDHGPLAEPITVTGAGDGPAIRIRVGFNEGLI